MALSSPQQESRNPSDQQRLSDALSMVRERLAAFKGTIRRAVALVDEFDGHEVPVVIEADVEVGEPYHRLEMALAHEVFSHAYRAVKVLMPMDIVSDLTDSVAPTARVALLA